MNRIRAISAFAICLLGMSGCSGAAPEKTAEPPVVLHSEPGVVAGLVFEDTNRNGAPDDGERRMAGETVLITNTDATERIASTTTDGEGRFAFDDLRGGQLRVSLQVPSGYARTNDDSLKITLATDRILPVVQFGVARP